MLADALKREQDIQLANGVPDSDAAIAAARLDAVVCEAEDPHDAALPMRLLGVVPQARVVVIADKGDRAVLYELRLAHQALFDVSFDQVISAVRFGLKPMGP